MKKAAAMDASIRAVLVLLLIAPPP